MKFHVITLFPELVEAYATHSIIGRAVRNKVLSIKAYQLRDFARNKWNKVDERPYAGGPGMVLQAEPILRAAEKIITGKKKVGVIVTSAGGKQFTNAEILDKAAITVNKNAIPFDTQSPFKAGGVRLGTPAVTTRGMKEGEMREIADLIHEVLSNMGSQEKISAVRNRVSALTGKFPLYREIREGFKMEAATIK